MKYRTESDSLGSVQIPETALYGAQTQRALENFQISGLRMPRAFIEALGLIKAACAKANVQLQQLDAPIGTAIIEAAEAVASGHYDDHFPLDVFQTGSGTSSNMNANEVIAHLATSALQSPSGERENKGATTHPVSGAPTTTVHPNNQVNQSQSSNDVIPTALHLSCGLQAHRTLIPALEQLACTIAKRAEGLQGIVKTGRTHLMDAMPLTLGQELSGWQAQIEQHCLRIQESLRPLYALAIGGTAVGTGINTVPGFGAQVAAFLAEDTGLPWHVDSNYFRALSFMEPVLQLSGQLRAIATSFIKIANDLCLMNSGPLAGFSEIALPTLQPGSSMMPGKVNPVIPEAVIMAATQVIGFDTSVSISAATGKFQLNTMLTLIAYNTLTSIQLMTASARHLAEKALAHFTVNETHIAAQLASNPILITALNPIIGYEKGAEIAKRAYQEKRPIKDVAREMIPVSTLSNEALERLLDPKLLAHPHF